MHVFWAALVLALLALPSVLNAQTRFQKTYKVGRGPEVSCCQNGMAFGFTSIVHDPSIAGTVEITLITASSGGKVIATDPNGIAGTTWEIFLGPAVDACAFPVGQQRGGAVNLETYTCSTTDASTQLIFNTNGMFTTAPTAGHFLGSYDFPQTTFKANDIGQLVSAVTSTSSFPNGLSLQVLNWGGDVGADTQFGEITVTVSGIMH